MYATEKCKVGTKMSLGLIKLQASGIVICFQNDFLGKNYYRFLSGTTGFLQESKNNGRD